MTIPKCGAALAVALVVGSAGCGDGGGEDGGASADSFEVGSAPNGVAAVGSTVWVTDADDATVVRLDADSGEVSAIEAPTAIDEDDTFDTIVAGPGTPDAVAATADAVWVTDQMGGSVTVARIDPETDEVTDAFEAGGGGGAGDIAATDDDVWVLNGSEADGFALTRLDAGTGELVDTVGVSESTTAVAVAGDDVWTSTSGGSVIRIDPDTGDESEVADLDDVSFVDIAATESTVWVVDADAGELVRIDPASGEVVGTIDVDDDVSAVAVTDDGVVWAAFRDQGTVARVDNA